MSAVTVHSSNLPTLNKPSDIGWKIKRLLTVPWSYPVEKISSTVNGLPAHNLDKAVISLMPFRLQVSMYVLILA